MGQYSEEKRGREGEKRKEQARERESPEVLRTAAPLLNHHFPSSHSSTTVSSSHLPIGLWPPSQPSGTVHTDTRTGEKGKGRRSWRAIGKDGVTAPANRKGKSAVWPVWMVTALVETSATAAGRKVQLFWGVADIEAFRELVGWLSAGLRHSG